MSSKLLTVVGIGAVALAVSAGEASALENAKGTVTANVLNVRSGPGTNNKKIGATYKGDVLEILDSSKGWYKVRLSNGQEGWVSGNYLNVTTSSNTSVAEASKTIVTKGKVTANVLNVRSGVGTQHSIVGKLQKNTVVDVLDSSNGWYKVKLSNGQEGWCSGDYIQSVENAIITTPDVVVSSQDTVIKTQSDVLSNVKGRVTASALNVRSGIGTQHSVVGKLLNDTVVDLLEKSDGWYKVKLSNGVEGWCSGAYIQVLELDACKPPTIDGSSEAMSVSKKQDAILNVAMAQLNKPYVWGAEGPNSFDCSGFTQYVFKNAIGVNIPRVSSDQARFGEKIEKGSFQVGDLIYLDTSGEFDGVVSHVGIYIGNGEMIHASGSKTNPRYVMISKIDSGWYKDRVMGARRLI